MFICQLVDARLDVSLCVNSSFAGRTCGMSYYMISRTLFLVILYVVHVATVHAV